MGKRDHQFAVCYVILCSLIILATLAQATPPTPLSPSNLIITGTGQLTDVYGNFIFSTRAPVMEPSYVIGVASGVYYAKNGSTGKYDWQNSNCTAVCYNATHSLVNGGRIHFLSGRYVFSGGTYLDSCYQGLYIDRDNVMVDGEGLSTVLTIGVANSRVVSVWASNCTVTNLCVDGANMNPWPYVPGGTTSDALVIVRGGESRGYYNSFSNLLIINGLGADAFGMFYGFYSMVDHVVGWNCAAGIVFTHSSSNQASDCDFRDMYASGVWIQGSSWDNTVSSVHIQNSSQDGAIIMAMNVSGTWYYGQHNILSNCHFTDNAWNGITIYSSSLNTITGCESMRNNGSGLTIEDNGLGPGASYYNSVVGNSFFDDRAVPVQSYGIWEQNSSDYNEFTDNVIYNNVVAGVSIVGSHTIVRDNMGYVSSSDQILQPPAFSTASYIVGKLHNGSYYMQNGTNWHVDYVSTNASQVINNAIGNVSSGGNIFFKSGTYNLNGSVIGTNKDNVTLAFENGATLAVANNMNRSAMILTNCNNWLISGITINGNAANQALTGSTLLDPYGILLAGCSNTEIVNAHIDNVREFGVNIIAQAGQTSINSGVRDSKITNCGWNGITLGGSSGVEQSLYAIHNEVAYCGDVGITNYGYSDVVQSNKVHDMNGTTGFNNAHWGIGVEGGGYDLITGNSVNMTLYGIRVNTGDLNTVSSNDVHLSIETGIEIVTDGNLVVGNRIKEWDTGDTWKYGLIVAGNKNIVCDNILNSTHPDTMGIDITNSNNQVSGNSIQNCQAGYVITDSGTSSRIYQNLGYNPVGHITNWHTGNSQSSPYLVDSGNNATIQSAITYTNYGSPKLVFLSAGTVTAIIFDGTTLYSAATTCCLSLQPGDTFSVTFSSAPTIVVFGQ